MSPSRSYSLHVCMVQLRIHMPKLSSSLDLKKARACGLYMRGVYDMTNGGLRVRLPMRFTHKTLLQRFNAQMLDLGLDTPKLNYWAQVLLVVVQLPFELTSGLLCILLASLRAAAWLSQNTRYLCVTTCPMCVDSIY